MPIFLDKRYNGIIMFPMICKDCKREFKSTRKWQAYCSLKCGNRARYKRRQAKISKAFRLLKQKSINNIREQATA